MKPRRWMTGVSAIAVLLTTLTGTHVPTEQAAAERSSPAADGRQASTRTFQVDRYTPKNDKQARTLETLDDDGLLLYREDRPLWGASTHQFVTIDAPIEAGTESLTSLINPLTEDIVGDVTSFERIEHADPGKSYVIAWELGEGASSRDAWGTQRNIPQSSIVPASKCTVEPTVEQYPVPLRAKIVAEQVAVYNSPMPERCENMLGIIPVEDFPYKAIKRTEGYVLISNVGWVQSQVVSVLPLPLVAIDPGHGAIQREDGQFYDQHQLTLTGISEDKMVLDIARALLRHADDQREPVANFFLTRADDYAPFAPKNCGDPCGEDLRGRRQLAHDRGADFLISIHTQGKSRGLPGDYSFIGPFSDGSIALYRYEDDDSKAIGISIQDALARLGVKPRGAHLRGLAILSRDEPYDPDRTSVLIEVAHHTNDYLGCTDCDADKLRSPEFRESAGVAIYDGLSPFLVGFRAVD